MMIALLLANFGNTLAEFSGIAASSEIFGIPRFIGLPIAAIFIWGLIVKGNYRNVEKIFLVASFLYISYIIAGYLANPDWGTAFRDTLVPQVISSSDYLVMIIGIIGATISPWMQFYIQSSIVEKNIQVKDLEYSRIDAITGAFVTNFVAFFIIIACAATIFENGIPVNNVVDISLALEPLAGKYAAQLFSFGLLNASLFSAVILPLATAYIFCESLGYESGVSKGIKKAPVFHGIYLGFIILGTLIIMLP